MRDRPGQRAGPGGAVSQEASRHRVGPLHAGEHDGDIRTVHGWEAYLAWLDERVFIEGERVVCRFASEHTVPLARCTTPAQVLIEAFRLAYHLESHEPQVHAQHVARRFIALVRKPMKLPHDLPEVFTALAQALVVTPRDGPPDHASGTGTEDGKGHGKDDGHGQAHDDAQR